MQNRPASGNDAFVYPTGPSSLDRPFFLSLFLSRALVFVGLIAQIFVAFRFWQLTWDDSAITLGFARTFAAAGRIEPTPGSGIVEGYSTTLWMLLMTLAAKVVSSPDVLLTVAKISTLLLNLANILLIRRWLQTWNSELLANLVAGSIGCGLMFYETINGMETPLIMTLVLVMLLLYPSQSRIARLFYLFAGSAFLLTRWEAAWLLIPFILVERPLRRAIVSSITWLAVFLLSNYVRWRYFGSLLPNTIIAKHGVPYSGVDSTQELLRHVYEPLYIIGSCKIFFLAIAAALLYDHFVLKPPVSYLSEFRRSLRESWQLRFVLLFTLFALVLSTAIGRNWGPEFRSFYSAWPFLFCLLLIPVFSNPKSPVIPWTAIGLCGFALLRMGARLHELQADYGPDYMPGATVRNVEKIDTVLSDIQLASHHQTLVFAGPDMGALLLYSNGIRVIDLGLLCDPVLARQRYAAVDSYVLEQRQPDVIETHEGWTKLANLQTLPHFLNRYQPVYVDGMRVFIARNLISSIDPGRLTKKFFNATGEPEKIDLSSTTHDLTHARVDHELNQTFRSYLVLK